MKAGDGDGVRGHWSMAWAKFLAASGRDCLQSTTILRHWKGMLDGGGHLSARRDAWKTAQQCWGLNEVEAREGRAGVVFVDPQGGLGG